MERNIWIARESLVFAHFLNPTKVRDSRLLLADVQVSSRVWKSLELIAGHDPNVLMLGDIYIDDPEDVKWTGDYCYSRRHSRPEWKKLVAKTSMHAIYDDHDFGMDDCIPGSRLICPRKNPVLANFNKNWIIHPLAEGLKIPGAADFHPGAGSGDYVGLSILQGSKETIHAWSRAKAMAFQNSQWVGSNLQNNSFLCSFFSRR